MVALALLLFWFYRCLPHQKSMLLSFCLGVRWPNYPRVWHSKEDTKSLFCFQWCFAPVCNIDFKSECGSVRLVLDSTTSTKFWSISKCTALVHMEVSFKPGMKISSGRIAISVLKMCHFTAPRTQVALAWLVSWSPHVIEKGFPLAMTELGSVISWVGPYCIFLLQRMPSPMMVFK